VVCILEGSGNWPDSIDAIKRLKAAYYLSLSQALVNVAPCILSAAHASFLEVYKVCSNIIKLFCIASIFWMHVVICRCQLDVFFAAAKTFLCM